MGAQYCKQKKVKLLLAGGGGPYGCETLSLLHFLDNRLTDGSEIVSLTRWSAFTSQDDS
jgi:hypothetical protein